MILDAIVKRKKKDLARMKAERPFAELKAKVRNAAPLQDFTKAVRGGTGVSIIAEIKRASPSKGVLKEKLDPAEQARAYLEGGARAISVLTDEPFFQGSVDDLRAARKAAGLPVLRKDFVVEEYQLYEARVMLADAALLIARILEGGRLADSIALAREDLGLATLVEVHGEKELERALDAGATLIGINNRDLETFAVSLETTERLRPLVPDGTAVVSESGIARRDDIVRLGHLGVDGALIGEELVTSSDPAGKLRELLGATHGDAGNPGSGPREAQHA
ncbi:MAG: indole-3-glycerol phosphate synthase TrpC [Planctomycetota bacterium]|jgi:indole-3-glycerol phosphate synthase